MSRYIAFVLIAVSSSIVGCSDKPIADTQQNVPASGTSTGPDKNRTPNDPRTPVPPVVSAQNSQAQPSVIEPTKPTPPKPVPFDIQGMRVGDKLTDEFAYHHCPAKDKGKPDITGSDSIEINGKRVFILF